MIPEAAVEAAAVIIVQGDRGACECRRSIFDKHDVNPPCSTRRQAIRTARAALEAALPILLSHEREETRLAHVDAVVNAETVDRLEKELAEAKAQAWDECESAKYEIRLNASGDAWEAVKDNPYRSQA